MIFFISNDSAVNVCCLDISKAFDRLNHNCLLYKLLLHSVSLCVVKIWRNWYFKLTSRVRWGATLPDEFKAACGFRHAGWVSPILFNIYVDNILEKLSKYGCVRNGISCSAIMYADDLILLSPSSLTFKRWLKLALMNLVHQPCAKYCKIMLFSGGERFFSTSVEI